jgi:hypothetical protein
MREAPSKLMETGDLGEVRTGGMKRLDAWIIYTRLYVRVILILLQTEHPY